jgi:hypothetical protein
LLPDLSRRNYLIDGCGPLMSLLFSLSPTFC